MSKKKVTSTTETKKLETLFFYFRTGDYPIYHDHKGSWEFLYVTSGEYTHKINKKKFIIKPQTLCVLRPDDYHSTHENVPDSSYITCRVKTEYFMSLMSFLSRDVISKLQSLDEIAFHVSSGRNQHIHEIKNVFLSSSDFDYSLMCDALLLTYAECIINQFAKEKTLKCYNDGIQTFLNLLRNPVNLALPLRELISKTNYSYSHLNSIFTKEIGVSPSEYLKDKRLNYAKKLLSSTSYQHSYIAECIGFATYPRFCTFFKERTGFTPSQYAAKYHRS